MQQNEDRPGIPSDDMQQNEDRRRDNQYTVLSQVLGALLGLVLIVLAIVITGWVWTCWIMHMKKKGAVSLTSEQER